MQQARLSRFLVLALAIVSLCACRTTQPYYKISVLPDPRVQDWLTPSGDSVSFEKEGIWGAVQTVPYEALAQPSTLNREWTFANPFDLLYDSHNMPIVFNLLIENRSDTAITFNPSAGFSLIFKGAPLFPIGYDDLYQDLYGSRDGEARLEKIRKMLFRSYMTLNPGERTRGVLLFRRPDPARIKDTEILLQLHDIYSGKKTMEFIIPFRIEMEKMKIPAS